MRMGMLPTQVENSNPSPRLTLTPVERIRVQSTGEAGATVSLRLRLRRPSRVNWAFRPGLPNESFRPQSLNSLTPDQDPLKRPPRTTTSSGGGAD
jgi:hypothetical protein